MNDDLLLPENVFIQMSNSRSVCAVWDHYPSNFEMINTYSDFIGKKLEIDTVRLNTWIEKHKLIKSTM